MSRNKDGKTEDLRNMLMSFRIAELQTLLASCGRSRSGRKHELLGRAVSLLKSSEGSPMRERVRSRILELYHQRYPASGGSGGGNVSVPQSSYMPPMMSYPEKDEEPSYLNRTNHYSSNKHAQHRSSSSNFSMHESSHNNRGNHRTIHNNMYEPPSRTIHPTVAGVPLHPDVRFITLPFYEVVDVLNKPTSLVQKTVTGYQDSHLSCSLSPYQTQLITNSRSYNLKSTIEYAVQVHIRFCLAETSCTQEDLYPPRCKVIVNGKSCPLPGQPPPNAQNQEPRKPHRPVNITQLCRLSPMQSNQITIQWMPSDMGQRYAVTMHLVKAVPVSNLIRKLEERPYRLADHTISFIKEKLKQDPDSEIALTSLKVSLCCPVSMCDVLREKGASQDVDVKNQISRTKMKMPCRANNCNHLQCFDGETYIRLNERKPSWVCPVCDQKAHYDQLFKDGLFLNIIEKSTDCDDIVFFEDGSWRPLSDVQDPSKPLSQVVSTPKSKSKPPSIVDCKTPPTLIVNTPTSKSDQESSDTEATVMPKLEKAPQQASSSSSEKIKGGNADDDVEVICIDDSDSEDDDDDDDDDSTPVNKVPASMASTNRRTMSSYSSDNGQPPSSSLPFSDPELQGLDLYNLLPHEDREKGPSQNVDVKNQIAAAMYLDQAGILGQLTNANSSALHSPSSVIDISDE